MHVALATCPRGQENNGVPAAILELERVLAATTPPAPAPAVAVICTAVLARWYDAYFQQNRYRFRQRTTVTQHPDDPPADLSTWSLAQILAKIDGLFQTLLSTHGDTTATRFFARFSELRHDFSRGSQLPPTPHVCAACGSALLGAYAESLGADLCFESDVTTDLGLQALPSRPPRSPQWLSSSRTAPCQPRSAPRCSISW